MATNKQVLDLPLSGPDFSATTVREYLVELLHVLWLEGEGFSGKRPFGNSGWEYDLYAPLVAAGFVRGVLDQDGRIDQVDKESAHQMILSAILSLSEAA